MVKANQGGSGVGNLFISTQEMEQIDDPLELLKKHAFLKDDLYVVEELIKSSRQISPSLEFYVPRESEGEPRITYLSNQHFEDSGRFAGIIIDDQYFDQPWYPEFKEIGLFIAFEIQKMGYAGHFDLDSIVDDDDNLYLVEINARRTGGTFVHELLEFMIGKDYSSKVVVYSQNKLSSGNLTKLDDLIQTIGDIQFPIGTKNRGIIPALTSTLYRSYFGCIAVGENGSDAKKLMGELIKKIETVD